MAGKRLLKTNILLLLALLCSIETAEAYIGPGAGLGLVGFLVAVIVFIVVVFLGLILFPLKLLKAFIERRKQSKKE